MRRWLVSTEGSLAQPRFELCSKRLEPTPHIMHMIVNADRCSLRLRTIGRLRTRWEAAH